MVPKLVAVQNATRERWLIVLIVHHPSSRLPERHYAFHVLLGEFLGLEYQTAEHEDPNVVISDSDDASEKRLTLADAFFSMPLSDWLTPRSLPDQPLDTLDTSIPELHTPLPNAGIPIIYGQRTSSGDYCSVSNDRIHLGLDIFGSAFFMLTRYEELVCQVRDRHGRYPATASLAYREGFLERPIVNEYLELLWVCLHHLFPELRRSERHPRVFLSHDVDWPAVALKRTSRQILRAAAGDILKWQEPRLAARRLASWRRVQQNAPQLDVGNVFDFIMQTSERYHLTSTFYFIAGDGSGDIDGGYTVEDAWIRSLLKEIHERGHRIGIHPTYETYRTPQRIRREYERLRTVCDEERISQSSWGGRQHYLRWENPTTWQSYADASLEYDTTLSFADHIGFRCGVCYEYPIFHIPDRQTLPLRERPLIVMDATVFGSRDKSSMGLSPAAGVPRIAALKKTCARYNGDFTLLWHNNWMIQSRLRSAYLETVRLITDEASHVG